MKKLFSVVICALLLTSCIRKPPETSLDTSSDETSSVSSAVQENPSDEISADNSVEVSEDTSSQEEIFEFSIDEFWKKSPSPLTQ